MMNRDTGTEKDISLGAAEMLARRIKPLRQTGSL
jgi:hypothetical protein